MVLFSPLFSELGSLTLFPLVATKRTMCRPDKLYRLLQENLYHLFNQKRILHFIVTSNKDTRQELEIFPIMIQSSCLQYTHHLSSLFQNLALTEEREGNDILFFVSKFLPNSKANRSSLLNNYYQTESLIGPIH